MLTKRTFEAAARIIKNQMDVMPIYSAQKTLLEKMADDFAYFFARENPNFDRNKFMEACGIKG